MKKKTIRIERIRTHWEPDPSSELPDAERCEAIAVVSYLVSGEGGDRRLETLTSGGLNGIDGATSEYRAEVEIEQLRDLREHLRAFGVEVRNFAQIAGRADLQE